MKRALIRLRSQAQQLLSRERQTHGYAATAKQTRGTKPRAYAQNEPRTPQRLQTHHLLALIGQNGNRTDVHDTLRVVHLAVTTWVNIMVEVSVIIPVSQIKRAAPKTGDPHIPSDNTKPGVQARPRKTAGRQNPASPYGGRGERSLFTSLCAWRRVFTKNGCGASSWTSRLGRFLITGTHRISHFTSTRPSHSTRWLPGDMYTGITDPKRNLGTEIPLRL